MQGYLAVALAAGFFIYLFFLDPRNKKNDEGNKNTTSNTSKQVIKANKNTTSNTSKQVTKTNKPVRTARTPKQSSDE